MTVNEIYKENNENKEIRYYLGNYEEKTNHTNGITEKIHYLSGAIYIERSNGTANFYYAYTDYLGSLIALTNESGTVVERYAYDPWGKRRNPANWTEDDSRTTWIVNRDYTGHEHIDQFGIINMNGRVYDPLTAMFFSPDPFVQAPGNWLNYNRYSYCIGNPFRYTDPDGNNPFIILGLTLFSGYIGGVVTNHGELNPIEWNWKSPDTYVGIGVGMFLGYVGGYWLFNPGALNVGLGMSVNSQWGSAAIGVSGIGTTGGMSNWNLYWSTSAGGGGIVPLGERKPVKIPVPNKPKGDTRFLQSDYFEASQLLSYVSKQDGVERIMYETDLGYYFESANGYVFLKLDKVPGLKVNYEYWGRRENGAPIYWVESTIDGTYPFSLSQQGDNLYLNLSMAEKYRVKGFYHTHPNNFPLSREDPFQDLKGVTVRAIGWDGYSRRDYEYENFIIPLPEFNFILKRK